MPTYNWMCAIKDDKRQIFTTKSSLLQFGQTYPCYFLSDFQVYDIY